MSPRRSLVPEGHANFPRLGWTLYGMTIGALSLRFASFGFAAIVLGVWGGVWLLWLFYLLGRRHGS